MFQLIFSRPLSVLSVLAVFATLSVQAANAQRAGEPLQGNVTMQQSMMINNPTLKREDLDKNGDPFSSQAAPDTEQFDAPEGSFAPQMNAPPPPAFGLNAEEQGGFQGSPAAGSVDPGQAMMSNQGMLPPMAQNNPNDPDNSQHMQIQWELWHRRVAEAIFMRFDALAQRAFAQSRPIACQAAYTVTRDRQITNVRLLHKSNNIVFNSMLLMVLKSMNGQPILEFPPGSRRQFVEKTGTFSRNYGVQGFKYTTGDQESVNNK